MTTKAACPEHSKDGRAGPYGGEWKAIREKFLLRHPLCAICRARATEVNHVKMIRAGGQRLATSNLQSLCGACHRRLTVRETRTPTWRKPR